MINPEPRFTIEPGFFFYINILWYNNCMYNLKDSKTLAHKGFHSYLKGKLPPKNLNVLLYYQLAENYFKKKTIHTTETPENPHKFILDLPIFPKNQTEFIQRVVEFLKIEDLEEFGNYKKFEEFYPNLYKKHFAESILHYSVSNLNKVCINRDSYTQYLKHISLKSKLYPIQNIEEFFKFVKIEDIPYLVKNLVWENSYYRYIPNHLKESFVSSGIERDKLYNNWSSPASIGSII